MREVSESCLDQRLVELGSLIWDAVELSHQAFEDGRVQQPSVVLCDVYDKDVAMMTAKMLIDKWKVMYTTVKHVGPPWEE